MALLTPQVVAPITGTSVTLGAVASSDTIAPNSGYRFILVVVNGNASADTVTITSVTGTDPFGRAFPTQTISVTNATTKYIYLDHQSNLADATTGLITITHSVTSSVTCAVIAIAK